MDLHIEGHVFFPFPSFASLYPSYTFRRPKENSNIFGSSTKSKNARFFERISISKRYETEIFKLRRKEKDARSSRAIRRARNFVVTGYLRNLGRNSWNQRFASNFQIVRENFPSLRGKVEICWSGEDDQSRERWQVGLKPIVANIFWKTWWKKERRRKRRILNLFPLEI